MQINKTTKFYSYACGIKPKTKQRVGIKVIRSNTPTDKRKK